MKANPRTRRWAISVVIIGLISTILATAQAQAQTQKGPVARTTSGEIVGLASPYGQGINAYYGVPFASAPVGDLRWRPPEPHSGWSNPRDTTRHGSPCMQPLVPETSLYSRGPIVPSEDCLYLNLWAPAKIAEPRAVMVWFHGGGNTTGHGSSLIFDGTRLAEKGVLVVTANYRMGSFGFLAHPALTAESEEGSSGNYALLDQIAVLEWVRDNIAAFGGDPSRVVIFGQSAGALDVCLLMASPLAEGLMSGVIGHSGGCMNVATALAEAEADGEKVAEQFDDAALGSLRSIPAAEFAERAAGADVPLSRPIVDGWIIPDMPRRIFMAGRQNRVPMIVGDMADEFRGLGADMPETSLEAFRSRIQETYPAIADELIDRYTITTSASPREALRKISTHASFTWQSRTWADLVSRSGDRAYVYHFTHPTAVFSLYIPERPEFPDPEGPRGLGAYHSGDLAYHFNNVGLVGIDWEDWDFRLADIISDYWVAFAETGDPSGRNLPVWPAYQRADDLVQEFGTNRVWTVRHPIHEELNLFDQAFPEP